MGVKSRKNILKKNSIKNKIIALYIIFLLLISIIPIAGISEKPEISSSHGDDTTSNDYVNVSVDITCSEDVSSFIDWNRSLVGFWNFEHMNSTHIFDNSTWNNNATMVNRFQNNNTTGRYGNGFYFNGSGGGQLNISHSSEFNITDELTLELWFKEFETSFNKTFNFGNSYNDFGYCIENTSDGGYIVVGECNWSASDDESGDVFLVKINSDGSTQWKKSYGWDNNYEDYGNSVVQTDDGGYAITGTTGWNSSTSNQDFWFLKTNGGGNIVTDGKQTMNFSNVDIGKSIIVNSSDNNYIIVGLGKNESSDYDLWFVNINNSNLNDNVSKAIDMYSSNQKIYSIEETSNNFYIACGRNYSNPDTGAGDILFMKLQYINGNITLKNHSVITNEGKNDGSWEIIENNDNNYVIIGYQNETNQECDLYISILDQDGVEINNISGELENLLPKYVEGRSIQQTRDNGYIITGSVNGSKNGTVLIKTTSTLEHEWINYFEGTFNYSYDFDNGWSVKECQDGGYIITGSYYNGNDWDLQIIKTNSTGNLTGSNNNQSLNKTLIGKGRKSYQLELCNGTITGYLNGSDVVSNYTNLYNLSQNWNHLVLTYDKYATDNNVKLYLNKELISQNDTFSENISLNLKNLTIGKNFSGIIDEVRVWNRRLTPEEIEASYNANLAGSYYRNFTNLSSKTYNYSIYSISQSGNENSTNKNLTINQYLPDPPSIFTATAESTFKITLTWIEGEKTDKTYIKYKEGTVPPINRLDGSYLYNDTGNSVSKTELETETYYSFTAWSWNETGKCYSIENVTCTKRTKSGGGGSNSGSYTPIPPNEEENNETTYDTNDTIGPNISLISPIDEEKIYDKTPKIKISFSDESGINISSIVFKLDGNIITKGISSTGIVYTPDTKFSLGIHSIHVKISDIFGNLNSKSWSFSIRKSIYHEKQNITNSTKKETMNIYPINKTKTIIDKIEIKPKKNYTNLEIGITDIGKNISKDIEKPDPEKIEQITPGINKTYILYRYLNLSIKSNNSYVKENFEEVKINFTVNSSWLKKHEINISNISMLRYNNNSWGKLNTSFLNEKEHHKLLFQCITSGFSTFAVVGSKVVKKEKNYEKPLEIPWIIIIGFLIAAIVILILVLFKTGYIYIEKE